jgi:hypothetical protein
MGVALFQVSLPGSLDPPDMKVFLLFISGLGEVLSRSEKGDHKFRTPVQDQQGKKGNQNYVEEVSRCLP